MVIKVIRENNGKFIQRVPKTLVRVLDNEQRVEQLSKHLLGTLKSTWNPPHDGRKVRINAIGFFYESPEVGAFLWALARENDGSFVGMSKP